MASATVEISTSEGATPTAPSQRQSGDAVPRNVDKDKIIEQLANEKQLLAWKVGELEEIIEDLKSQTANLEDQVVSLTQANVVLKEKLDSKPSGPRRATYLGSHVQRSSTLLSSSLGFELESSFLEPVVQQPNEEGRKKRPSLPPPPIPPLITTPSNSTPSSPYSSAQPSPEPLSPLTPLSPMSGTMDEPWSSGNIDGYGYGGGGWNSGVRPESMNMKDRAKVSSFALNHSASLNNLPSLPANYTIVNARNHESVREERSKTSPIPAPSPCIYGSRAVSLSSPAFPESELSMPSSPEPWTDGEVEDEADPDLIWDKKEDGKRFVKGGTLDKLVERLTYDRAPETNYVNAFLLTYKSFTTPMDLLDKLIARYNIEPTEELTGDAVTLFERRKKIIQLRVGNVIKTWVDKHFHDFEKDPALKASVSKFVETQLEVDMVTIGKTITKLLTQTRGALCLTFNNPPPPAMIPKTSDFLDFDPLEVARQLTVIEYELYKGIEAKECLNQAWSGQDKEQNAPHIVSMIKRFNLVSAWVATEIVNTEKIIDRVMKVKKFLNIAKMCRDIGNFNGIMEILAGLQNAAIHRLKKTWEKVLSKAKYDDLYNSLLSLMSNNNNFRDYRAALHSCQPPCIPYLGVFLTDLTFIEDGTKDTLNGRDDLIHFEKRRKVSVVIRDIQQYQQSPYHFNVEVTIKDALITLESMNENTLFNISMQCEPRETEEMKKEKKETGTYAYRVKEMSMASLSFLKDFNFNINK